MKKSFILHTDSLAVLDELSDQQAGQLFKAIRNYNEGLETELDFGLRMAFLPFKHQFDRDAEKYASIVERNRKNAVKGGRPKKPIETHRNPVGLFGSEASPENLDSDSGSDSVSDSGSGKANSFLKFWDIFGKKVDKTKCEKAWNKIPVKQHLEIIEKAMIYVTATPDIKYRKNPLTWLNGKCWEDEIEEVKPTNTKYIPTL